MIDLVKSNAKFLAVAILSGGALAFTTGCLPFLDSLSASPRSAEAQTTYSNDPAIAQSQRIAQGVSAVGNVAGTVAALPTPASPIAASVSNFTDGYQGELLARLSRIEQRQADQAARGEAVTGASRSEISQSHLYAFLAGLSVLLVKTRKGQQAVFGTAPAPTATTH